MKKDLEKEIVDSTTRTEPGIVITDETSTTKTTDPKVEVIVDKTESVVKPATNATLVNPTKGVTGASAGFTPGIGSMRSGSYSGDEDKSLVSDASQNRDVKESYNPEGRFRKKVDLPIKNINDIVSEQILVEEKSAPTLDEDRDATEGRAPRRISENTRIQKASGTQVAERSFIRSIDEIKRDELLFTDGQNVNIEGRYQTAAPDTFTAVVADKDVVLERRLFPDGETVRPTEMRRGNYVPRFLNITFKKNANGVVIKDFEFDVDDISITLDATEEDIYNKSATHAKIHSNYSEIVRQQIEDKAGNEAEAGWSPLARAISNATANVGFLKDIELDLGNTISFAHKKTSDALAYAINRASKDGLHIMSPIQEAVVGPLLKEISSRDQFENKASNFLFDKSVMKQGAASLVIAAFDTTRKYDSKGVFYNMKRKSFANALSVAEVNAANFKVSEKFIKAVNNHQTFSTINKEYDPLAPVFITDNTLLSHNYNFNDFINIKNEDKNYLPHNRHFGMGYSYRSRNNRYITKVDHPLVVGLYDYFVQYANSYYNALVEKDKTEATLSIPVLYSTTKITLWSQLLLLATPQMARARLASMREILDYENVHGYPYEILGDLKSTINSSSINYGFSSIDEPLSVKRMDSMNAITWIMPEMWHPYDEIGAGKYRFISPFYVNEEAISFRANGSWENEGDRDFYSFPIVRNGVTTETLQQWVNFKPSEMRLAYDFITKLPINKGAKADGSVYKYDLTTDGVFAFNDTVGLKYRNILKLPREIGMRLVLPYGYASPINDKLDNGVIFNRLDTAFNGGTSFRAKLFYTTEANIMGLATPSVNSINQKSSAIHTLSANLRQSWIASHAGDQEDSTIINGIQMSLSSPFQTTGATGAGTISLVEGVSYVSPFVEGYNNDFVPNLADNGLVNISNPIHVRLNLLPFIVSPWDSKPRKARTGEDGIEVDPYTFAYMFNFVGFYSIDYAEEVAVRLDEIQDMGPYFTEDRWLKNRYQ